MADRRFDPWVMAAFVVGVALRMVHLGAAPLWFDETYTFHHLVVPWHGYVGTLMQDNQAPLYYATTKAWTQLAGLTPWALRIPGLVASVACIPIVAAIARLLLSERSARAAAWLAAISPFLIEHAQDARPYALLAALASFDLLLLVRFVQGRSPRLGVLWLVCSVAVVATHYFGIFFLAGQGLALLLLRTQPLRNWLPAGIVAGAIAGTLVLQAISNSSAGIAGNYVFGVLALPGVIWSMLTGYTLMPTSEQLHVLGRQAILQDLPIALVALPAFVVVAVAGFRALGGTGRIVLLTTFGVSLLTPFGYRLVAGAGVHPRYFAAAIAPLLIIAAGGMTTRLTSASGAASVLLVTVMLYATFLHLQDTGHGREDVDAAGHWLAANVPFDEEILITSIEMETLARFHWPNRRFRLYPPEHGIVADTQIPDLVASLPFGAQGRTIFLVGRAWLSDPDGKLQAALDARYSACPGVTVRGIRIYCYEQHTPPQSPTRTPEARRGSALDMASDQAGFTLTLAALRART